MSRKLRSRSSPYSLQMELPERVMENETRVVEGRVRIPEPLGRDLQITARVVLGQLFDPLRRAHREIIPDARCDEDSLDSRNRARFAIEPNQRSVIRSQVVADVGIHTRREPTRRLDLTALASQAIHVRGRSAQVADDAGEARCLVANVLDLAQDRSLGSTLDDASFVLGDRTEATATKAATHDRHRKLDHLICRNPFSFVGRVRNALKRKLVQRVHFRRSQRNRRRIHPDLDRTVTLNQRACISGVRFAMQDARCMGIQRGITTHLLEAGKANHLLGARRLRQRNLMQGRLGRTLSGLTRSLFPFLFHRVGIRLRIDASGLVNARGVDLCKAHGNRLNKRCSAQITNFGDVLSGSQAMRDLDDGTLCISEHEQIRTGFHKDRSTDFV